MNILKSYRLWASITITVVIIVAYWLSRPSAPPLDGEVEEVSVEATQ